jgi:hypothetical protein
VSLSPCQKVVQFEPLGRTCSKELVMTLKMQGLRELTDSELDLVTGGDKPNSSGWNGGDNHKIGNLSQNPNDGNGAYIPGNK